MNVIIFDPHPTRDNLLPLTYTRPIGDLRIGITTIAEKWAALLPGEYSWQTEPYLSELFPCHATPDSLYVAGNVVPDAQLARAVASLAEGDGLYYNNVLIARRGNATERRDYSGAPLITIDRLYHIFMNNGEVLRRDFEAITAGRRSQPLSPTVQVIGDRSRVFVEEGASLECCVLNTTTGPIYIGRDATVMEGSLVRGPFALCEHATLNMGTKIYPDTTVGPWCKVGGELNNAVLHSYSNKANDGSYVRGPQPQEHLRPHTPLELPHAPLRAHRPSVLRPHNGRPQQGRHQHHVQHGHRRGRRLQHLRSRPAPHLHRLVQYG